MLLQNCFSFELVAGEGGDDYFFDRRIDLFIWFNFYLFSGVVLASVLRAQHFFLLFANESTNCPQYTPLLSAPHFIPSNQPHPNLMSASPFLSVYFYICMSFFFLLVCIHYLPFKLSKCLSQATHRAHTHTHTHIHACT